MCALVREHGNGSKARDACMCAMRGTREPSCSSGSSTQERNSEHALTLRNEDTRAHLTSPTRTTGRCPTNKQQLQKRVCARVAPHTPVGARAHARRAPLPHRHASSHDTWQGGGVARVVDHPALRHHGSIVVTRGPWERQQRQQRHQSVWRAHCGRDEETTRHALVCRFRQAEQPFHSSRAAAGGNVAPRKTVACNGIASCSRTRKPRQQKAR